MLGARERFARPPVIGNLVIVPLREHGNLGVEREHVFVEQVVFVVSAELGQRFRRLRFVLGNDIPPHLPVRHLLFCRDRRVGVDGVTVVDEKVRAILQHGRVGAHAAARLIDAPALSGGVARPHKTDRAPVVRRGTETADFWFAGNSR